MEGMILAAGLGTRLGDLTRDTPKALIEVAGVPMLERVARRLIDAGVDRLIVNAHHHADRIVAFLEENSGFGVDFAVSREDDRPLDTGGGVSHARALFRGDGPFILHNVDILSSIPLRRMFDEHAARDPRPLATLAVMRRSTSRYLLFDDDGLAGRVDHGKDLRILARPERGEVRELAFAGVHVVSPEIFEMIDQEGAFSILDVYLAAVGRGFRVEPYLIPAEGWIDIGRPEQLARAEKAMAGAESER